MSAPVARIWKGYGTSGGVKRYCDEHFSRLVLPELRALDGFLGATVLVREGNRETELVVLTRWASISAIRQFAGEDYEQAVVEPVVRDMLDRYDDRVKHFSIALTAEAEDDGA